LPSSNAKKSSKKSADLPKKGFSSLNEEKEFQAIIRAKATKVGILAAVKFVTETMGWGLKEAKDYCDRVLATAPATDKKTTPARQAAPLGAALGQVSLEKIAGDGKFEAGHVLLEQTGWDLNTDNLFGDPLKEKGKKAPEKPSLSPKASASGSPSPENGRSFDLEHEIQQLMKRTGWDYLTAKSYCERSLDYHNKVSAGTSLKK
jgi:ribosomal protein L7/L12